MSTLLYIKASPRGDRSKSIDIADRFLEAYLDRKPDGRIVTLDLFNEDLPAFDGPVIQAKYNIMHGREHSAQQRRAWRAVESVIEQFKAADRYLLACPMWNFGVPYRLKQYVDILVQPGYTFNYDPNSGYTGLVTGKKLMAIYASGGTYLEGETSHLDMRKPYVELIFGFIGIKDIQSVAVEPTLQGAPEEVAAAVEKARRKAVEAAVGF